MNEAFVVVFTAMVMGFYIFSSLRDLLRSQGRGSRIGWLPIVIILVLSELLLVTLGLRLYWLMVAALGLAAVTILIQVIYPTSTSIQRFGTQQARQRNAIMGGAFLILALGWTLYGLGGNSRWADQIRIIGLVIGIAGYIVADLGTRIWRYARRSAVERERRD